MGRRRIKPSVIGLAGRIGSGKSTISEALAQALQWPRASFGDYVRSVATSRGLSLESRETLQVVGLSLIEDGWPEFCQNVLSFSGWRPGQAIVVDGIRHAKAVETLSEIVSPLSFVLVYVTVGEQVRHERMIQRDGLPSEPKVESHSTEADVSEMLPRMASLTVDASASVEAIVLQILDQLDQTQRSGVDH